MREKRRGADGRCRCEAWSSTKSLNDKGETR